MGLWCRLVLIGLLGASFEVAAEVSTLHFGGTGGEPWSEWTLLDLMVEDATPALQPLELRPDENVIAQLSYWERSLYPATRRSTLALRYAPDMAGHGHIFAGIAVPEFHEVHRRRHQYRLCHYHHAGRGGFLHP